MLSGLAQPLMYLLALGAGLDSVFKAAGYGDYGRFISPGVVTMSIMTTAFVGGLSVLWDRKFGFLKETLVAPVPRTWVVLGRAAGATTTALVQGILVLAIASLLGGGVKNAVGLLYLVLMMASVGLFFAAFGVFAGSIIEDFQSVQLIVTLVLMPLFFLSGALFPIATVARNPLMAWVVRLNPVTYCVDGMRAAFGMESHFDGRVDAAVVVGITILGVVLGAWAFSRVKVT